MQNKEFRREVAIGKRKHSGRNRRVTSMQVRRSEIIERS